MSLLAKLPIIEGSYRRDVDLSATNWFRVGGKAEILFRPKNIEELTYFLANKPTDCVITTLGVGSNVIIRDGGIKGVVIKLGREFNYLKHQDTLLSVGAATLDSNVAQYAADCGLSGLEFMIGVPGCIGGALAMNAGAYGGQVADFLVEATAVEISTGKIFTLSNQDFGFKYRGNSLEQRYIFTEAKFKLTKNDPVQIKARMEEIVKSRGESQPVKERTGGSTFKNPEGYKAWELIDQAGCRGLSVGDAEMSEKHCNFLINRGNASASEIEELGELVIKKVYDHCKIKLQWEIKRIGEKNA